MDITFSFAIESNIVPYSTLFIFITCLRFANKTKTQTKSLRWVTCEYSNTQRNERRILQIAHKILVTNNLCAICKMKEPGQISVKYDGYPPLFTWPYFGQPEF